jgi:TetR/AcrR family transcriptional regulator of autoinduction and epiphytic fitness
MVVNTEAVTAGDGPDPSDGRNRRSSRTRDAIVRAIVDLVAEGGTDPTAPQVADRAGVSVRTVYGHFATLSLLHDAVVQHVTGLVLERLELIDPSAPTAEKVDVLCGQRARINEELGALLVAASRLASRSPELDASRRFGRAASLDQIRRVFADELARWSPGVQARRVAVIHALVQVDAWVELREEAGLDPDRARIATTEAVALLLAGP